MKKCLFLLTLLSITASNYSYCCGNGSGWGWGLGAGLMGMGIGAAVASSNRRPREVIYVSPEAADYHPQEDQLEAAFAAGQQAEQERLAAFEAGVKAGKKEAYADNNQA